MKTLDEALTVVCPPTGGERNGKVLLSLPGQTDPQLMPLVQRYSPTAGECTGNRKVQRICIALQEAVQNGAISPADALVSAFITGLMTGMEMEKAE